MLIDFFIIGTTFWLLANNEEIYAHMSMGAVGCVGTLVFSRMISTLTGKGEGEGEDQALATCL